MMVANHQIHMAIRVIKLRAVFSTVSPARNLLNSQAPLAVCAKLVCHTDMTRHQYTNISETVSLKSAVLDDTNVLGFHDVALSVVLLNLPVLPVLPFRLLHLNNRPVSLPNRQLYTVLKQSLAA